LNKAFKVDKTKPSAFNDTHYFGGATIGGTILPHKFKFRFTSKSSCKKFDLNVSFSHEHDDSPQLFLEYDDKECYEYKDKESKPPVKTPPYSAWEKIPPFTITPEQSIPECDVGEGIQSTAVATAVAPAPATVGATGPGPNPNYSTYDECVLYKVNTEGLQLEVAEYQCMLEFD